MHAGGRPRTAPRLVGHGLRLPTWGNSVRLRLRLSDYNSDSMHPSDCIEPPSKPSEKPSETLCELPGSLTR